MPDITNVSNALKNYWSWFKELYSANAVPTIIAPELNNIDIIDSTDIGISFFGEDSTREN